MTAGEQTGGIFGEDHAEKVAFGAEAAREILVWEPERVEAVVIAVHGGLSHAGDYINLGVALREAGFATVARQLPGHGGQPTAHVDRFAEFVVDLHAVGDWVVDRYPTAPLFAVGHSMGALIVTFMALDGWARRHPLRGYVLSAPYYRNAMRVSPVMTRLSRLLSAVMPRMHVPLEDFSRFLTHDPEQYRRIQADRAAGRRNLSATVRFATELLWAQREVERSIAGWNEPVLAFVAGADRIADAEVARQCLSEADASTVTVRFLPEAYHELFNETERDQIFAEIVSWMRASLAVG